MEFTNNADLIAYTKSCLADFTNKYSETNYYDDWVIFDFYWNEPVEIEEWIYWAYISKNKLIEKSKNIYLLYSDDLSKMNFDNIKNYKPISYYWPQWPIEFSPDSFSWYYDELYVWANNIRYIISIDTIKPIDFKVENNIAFIKCFFRVKMICFNVYVDWDVVQWIDRIINTSEELTFTIDNVWNFFLYS